MHFQCGSFHKSQRKSAPCIVIPDIIGHPFMPDKASWLTGHLQNSNKGKFDLCSYWLYWKLLSTYSSLVTVIHVHAIGMSLTERTVSLQMVPYASFRTVYSSCLGPKVLGLSLTMTDCPTLIKNPCHNLYTYIYLDICIGGMAAWVQSQSLSMANWSPRPKLLRHTFNSATIARWRPRLVCDSKHAEEKVNWAQTKQTNKQRAYFGMSKYWP